MLGPGELSISVAAKMMTLASTQRTEDEAPRCARFPLQGRGLACSGLLISVLWCHVQYRRPGGLEQRKPLLAQGRRREAPGPPLARSAGLPAEAPGSVWPQASRGTLHPCVHTRRHPCTRIPCTRRSCRMQGSSE